MANKVYVGQIGVVLEVTIDVSNTVNFTWGSVTSHEIICLLPDGNTKTYETQRANNVLTFTSTSADDFPVAGRYYGHPRLVGNGFDLLGNAFNFVIHDKFR